MNEPKPTFETLGNQGAESISNFEESTLADLLDQRMTPEIVRQIDAKWKKDKESGNLAEWFEMTRNLKTTFGLKLSEQFRLERGSELTAAVINNEEDERFFREHNESESILSLLENDVKNTALNKLRDASDQYLRSGSKGENPMFREDWWNIKNS